MGEAAIRSAAPEADVDHADGAPERPAPQSGFDNSALAEAIGGLAFTGLQEGVGRTVAHFQRLNAG